MAVQLTSPILVIGLGGLGSRVSSDIAQSIDADYVVISSDEKDLQKNSSDIKISTNSVVNPSIPLIRGATLKESGLIGEKISQYSTILIVANLAGKNGAAISPVVSSISKESGKNVISFAIMPFKYEKERIFSSGVSLKRLRNNSNCTIVIDNDAMLENNPDLTPQNCYKIANDAMLYVVKSFKSTEISEEANIISTSKPNIDLETSLKESLKMLYETTSPNKVKRSIIQIIGGNNVPVGLLNSISNLSSGTLTEENQVGIAEGENEETKIIMLSSIQGETRFDNYDPLGVIPQDKTLDWNEPECSIDCKLDLYQLE